MTKREGHTAGDLVQRAEQAVKLSRPDLYATFDSEIRATIRALEAAGFLHAPIENEKGRLQSTCRKLAEAIVEECEAAGDFLEEPQRSEKIAWFAAATRTPRRKSPKSGIASRVNIAPLPKEPVMAEARKVVELIERLEKATGPDWEFDIEILEIVFPDQYKSLCAVFEETWKKAQENGLHDRRLACWRSTFMGAPSFTRSLLAAVTLVPEDYAWDVRSQADYFWASVADKIEGQGFFLTAKTPALALCIAALRARSALTEKQG